MMMTFLTLMKKNSMKLKKKIELASKKLFRWFHEIGMKAKQDKCHIFEKTARLSLPGCPIKNSSSEKILGIIIDRKRNFK